MNFFTEKLKSPDFGPKNVQLAHHMQFSKKNQNQKALHTH